MSERESMKLRELKEAAHALYQRGRYAQCAETYAQLAKRLPRDANVRIRLASACRRAGQQEQAIAAYREAARVLLSLGCESRARGALKVALELDPRNAALQQDLARMGQGAVTPAALEDEELYRFDRLPPPTPPPGRMRIVPPSITPVNVLRKAPIVPPVCDAAAETPSRPVADAPRPPEASPLPKVIVSMGAFVTPPPVVVASRNTPPSITPVMLSKPALPKVQPALPPSPPSAPPPERPTVKVLALRNRDPEARLTPPPSAPAPHAAVGSAHASSLTAPPVAVMPFKPEMRRLSPNVVALRVSPQARWVIIRSESELEVSRSEVLPDESSASH